VKFCSAWAGEIQLRVPEGDDRNRFVCAECEFVHYVNPRVIVGCLPIYEDRVLLGKRSIEPRYGFWPLPAGFMENGETTADGAARETWEEARAKVSNMQLYRVFDVPYINQVYMFYRCTLDRGEYGVGPESLETDLYTESQVPWDEIAFPVVKKTLVDFFEDRRRCDYPIKVEAITWRRPVSDS
jgi:ADP-ribose pyrophosphatase YjhB (NUDIX family)